MKFFLILSVSFVFAASVFFPRDYSHAVRMVPGGSVPLTKPVQPMPADVIPNLQDSAGTDKSEREITSKGAIGENGAAAGRSGQASGSAKSPQNFFSSAERDAFPIMAIVLAAGGFAIIMYFVGTRKSKKGKKNI